MLLKWLDYLEPNAVHLGFRGTSALCLTANKQVGSENYLLPYFLSPESGYWGSVFISIWYRNNTPIDFCTGYPSAQDAAWVLLFTLSWCILWVALLMTHRAAWISCLFLTHAVVGPLITTGTQHGFPVHSFFAHQWLDLQSVQETAELFAFLVHQWLDSQSAQDSASIPCSLSVYQCLTLSSARHIESISCSLFLGTSVGGTPNSTGLSMNFHFTVSWYTSGWASHQHKDSLCVSGL